jgi:hypothetical protein
VGGDVAVSTLEPCDLGGVRRVQKVLSDRSSKAQAS